MVKLRFSSLGEHLKTLIDSTGNSASWSSRGFGEDRGRRRRGLIQRQEAQLHHMQRCFLLIFKTQRLSCAGRRSPVPPRDLRIVPGALWFLRARVSPRSRAEIPASLFRFPLACFSAALGSRAISYRFFPSYFCPCLQLTFLQVGADHSTGQLNSDKPGQVVPQPLESTVRPANESVGYFSFL